MDECRQAICRWGRHLWEAGLVRGSSGNLSCRVGEEFLITPAGSSLFSLEPDQLVLARLDGGEGSVPEARRTSSETPLHRLVYQRVPGARAVVHTHSPYAAALSRRPWPPAQGLPEGLSLERVDSHAPGSQALAEAVSGALAAGAQGVLLEGHGVVTASESLEEAVIRAELVEEWAQIYCISLLLERRGEGA